MQINGYIVLGMLMSIAGGITALQIVDITPPTIDYSQTVPEASATYGDLAWVQLHARDSETGIKNVRLTTREYGPGGSVFELNFYLQFDFSYLKGGQWWECWTEEIPGGWLEGTYYWFYTVTNNADQSAQTPEDNYFIIDYGSTEEPGSPDPPPSGNMAVIGYFDSDPVPCTVYYEITSSGIQYVSEVVEATAEGIVWNSIPVGNYEVHGTYQNFTALENAVVSEGQTTVVQLSFGGSEPPPTTEIDEEEMPSAPESGYAEQSLIAGWEIPAIFMAVGGVVVIYGFTQPKIKKVT